MAKQSQMCTYRWAAGQGKYNTRDDDVIIDEQEFKDITKHRPRLACPECGRRLAAWAQIHDGELMCWRIPEHKRKGWWKKPRKKVERFMAPRGK
jgi:transcriptional regulator NrdR family protein